MLKMTGLDVLFAAAGNLYLLLALAGICVAFWVGKTWARRLMYTALVIALFIAPIAPEIYRTIEYRGKVTKARALFEERCKTAGEKIYKTVENVEGVLLMNGRKRVNKSEQFDPNDPAGDDAHGLGYVESFLMGRVSDVQQTSKTTKEAYRYVDITDSDGQKRYRFIGKPTPRPASPDVFDLRLVKEVAPEPAPRYGVVWEDLSKPEDRQAWIAGSAIRIVDLQTKEVLGERIGYVIDKGQGDTNGGRSPWAYAAYTACPAFPRLHEQYPHKWALTRNFAEKVIKPVSGE